MKRLLSVVLFMAMLASLCSCGKKTLNWQEQYDLGVRYLSEGNYEEAILAFSAAIEIDPKQAPAYVGRGDAYVGVAETLLSDDTQNEKSTAKYKSALADYLIAIDLNGLDSDVYMKAAEVYIALGDVESAIAVLEQGFAATGDETLQTLLNDLQGDALDTFWTYFEMLEPDQQQYLETLVSAVEQENTEVAWEMLQSAKDVFGDSMWIKFGAYRLNITPLCTTELVAGDIEIRPESGPGFYCSWCSASMSSGDSIQRVYGSGQCEDWNWNGQYVVYDQSSDEYADHVSHETGTMKDSLLDGVVSRTQTSTDRSTGETDTFTHETTFKNGACIEGFYYDIYGREGYLYSAWGLEQIADEPDEALARYLWNLWD